MGAFVGIALGMFGISLMQLILATAMPSIVAEIGGDYLYGWVFSSYMLASLLTIPVFSKLADLYGKKKFYLLGMGIFGIGTLYGGFAPLMEHLIAARVIQGLGAGVMIPVSLAMISDMFPAEKRGHMIGAFSFIQLLANLFSPVLGSYITKQWGWHWIFILTFAVIVLAIWLVAPVKQASQSSQQIRWSRVDLVGGLVFGVFCVLVVGFSYAAGREGQLELAGGLLLLLGAVITGLILAWNEHHHEDPVIKVAFFRSQILRRSIISSLIAGAIMYGLVTILPLCNLILSSRGGNSDESRVLTVFMLGITIGILISSRLVTKLSVTFPRVLWGASVAGAGVLYYTVSVGSFAMFSIVTGVLGLALGGIMATLLINPQNAVSDGSSRLHVSPRPAIIPTYVL